MDTAPSSNRDRWNDRLTDLTSRRDKARSMGGGDRIDRHHGKGKLTARERIHALLDPGSFTELGMLVGGQVPSDALVCGRGYIAGRPVFVAAEDFTVLGGSVAPGNAAKRYRILTLALQERCPVLFLLEGAGYRPQDRKAEATIRGATDLLLQPEISGRVPFVAAVLGSSAGHSAITAAAADWTVMTSDGSIFAAGPTLVRDATGQTIDKVDLGGPAVAINAGTVHNLVDNDSEAMAKMRHYLSYFPQSAWSYAPVDSDGVDTGLRTLDTLADILPTNLRQAYDIRDVIECLVDCSEALEVQPSFGETMVCALGRLGGVAVGIVANQPSRKGGAIDRDGADKATHFVDTCSAFHLPLVFLCDNPGVLCGLDAERSGTLRAAGRLLGALKGAQTIKLEVTLRKAFGFGGLLMGQSHSDMSAAFVVLGATLGGMPARGGATVSGADERTSDSFFDAELSSSISLAEGGSFDDMIDPREMRNALLGSLKFAIAGQPPDPSPVARIGVRP